ncbi:hypothetical protein [Massilia violaceinigra]|nr:hypothetical protein [Massilia violaceinigra]
MPTDAVKRGAVQHTVALDAIARSITRFSRRRL